MAAKRRSLFGIGPTGSTPTSEVNQSKPRATTAPKHTPVAEKPMNLHDGNASIGSQGSGIEMIDIPNSRASRRMIRPPTGGTNPSKQEASSSINNNSMRPPSGQPAPLNQIQELH